MKLGPILLTLATLAVPGLSMAQNVTATPPPVAGPPPVPVQPGPPPIPTLSVYVVQNGAQTGPFTAPQLAQMATAGTLTPDSLVWQEGMANWETASTVPELGPILAQGGRTATDQQQGTDPKAYLVGTWVSEPAMVTIGEGTQQQGLANLTVEYKSDGSFEGSGTIQYNDTNGQNIVYTQLTGTFQAQQGAPGSILVSTNTNITFVVNGQTQTFQQNDTSVLQIVDQSTVVDNEGTKWHKQ